MSDTPDAISDRFTTAVRRAFDRDSSLKDVDIASAERIGEEAARVAIANLRWSVAAGRTLTTSDLIARWGVTRQAIAKRVKSGSIIALPGRLTTHFPAWQFDGTTGEVRPVVKHILKTFEYYTGHRDSMVIAAWAATPQPELDNRTPRDWIEAGADEERLIRLAQATARELAP